MDALTDRDHVLVAFDGPICTLPRDPTVAERLRVLLMDAKLPWSVARTRDPLKIMTHAATIGPATAQAVHSQLSSMEHATVAVAPETPGVRDALAALANVGTRLTVVSSLSVQAVRQYLVIHDLTGYVQQISARTGPYPDRLPPHPYLVDQAVRHRGIPPESCVFIGRTRRDLAAAHRAGIPTIAYGTAVRSMAELTTNIDLRVD